MTPVVPAYTQIGAECIRHMKLSAEAFLGKSVTHCVVTVPAYFVDAQKVRQRALDLCICLCLCVIICVCTHAPS